MLDGAADKGFLGLTIGAVIGAAGGAMLLGGGSILSILAGIVFGGLLGGAIGGITDGSFGRATDAITGPSTKPISAGTTTITPSGPSVGRALPAPMKKPLHEVKVGKYVLAQMEPVDLSKSPSTPEIRDAAGKPLGTIAISKEGSDPRIKVGAFKPAVGAGFHARDLKPSFVEELIEEEGKVDIRGPGTPDLIKRVERFVDGVTKGVETDSESSKLPVNGLQVRGAWLFNNETKTFEGVNFVGYDVGDRFLASGYSRDDKAYYRFPDKSYSLSMDGDKLNAADPLLREAGERAIASQKKPTPATKHDLGNGWKAEDPAAKDHPNVLIGRLVTVSRKESGLSEYRDYNSPNFAFWVTPGGKVIAGEQKNEKGKYIQADLPDSLRFDLIDGNGNLLAKPVTKEKPDTDIFIKKAERYLERQAVRQ